MTEKIYLEDIQADIHDEIKPKNRKEEVLHKIFNLIAVKEEFAHLCESCQNRSEPIVANATAKLVFHDYNMEFWLCDNCLFAFEFIARTVYQKTKDENSFGNWQIM